MNKKQKVWKPVYSINPAIAQALMGIEAAKAVVENTPLPNFYGHFDILEQLFYN